MYRVSYLILVLFFFPGSVAFAQTLQIQPNEIRAGQTAILIWDTAGAAAFVAGYGKKVVGKGSVPVSPDFTTDFTMVTETGNGIHYSTVRLLVNGAKGDEGYPSLGEFDAPLQDHRDGITYIDFQSAIWGLLQEQGYTVKGDYVPKRPSISFYTNFILRPDLISKNEKIRAKRLAMAVDIFEPKDGTISFAVRPRLEFQYRGETEWRSDKNSPVAQSEAKKIMQLLRSAK